jgi:kanamycin nucleotidyltransferase
MSTGPLPQTPAARRAKLTELVADLEHEFGPVLLAIGLYGSMARNEDGHYSDIELFCVINEPGLDTSREWIYGPGKVEVNLLGPDVVEAAAAAVTAHWSLEAGQWLRCRALHGDPAFFARWAALPFSAPDANFREAIEEMVVGELYEWIGKFRNGQARGDLAYLPTLACDFVRHTALLLGLAHRHVYRTSSSVLSESLTLTDLPDSYATLCRQVMTGDLADSNRTAHNLEALWTGLASWLPRHGIPALMGSAD